MEFLTKKLREIMPIPFFFLNIMHFRYYVIIVHSFEKKNRKLQ